MNNTKDFHKKKNGVIVNTNRKDYKRAKNRNFVRREGDKLIGESGKVATLENELADLKALVKHLMENR